MVDLGPLFALGESLARGAIDTAGTVVRFETRTTTTDPDTLEPVTATVVLGEHPAILTPVGTTTPQVLPGVELRFSDWKLTLTPDVAPPAVGAFTVVTASRDPHLPGGEGKVLGHTLSSAGAVLMVFARPVRT